MNRHSRLELVCLLLFLAPCHAIGYDPLDVPQDTHIQSVDLTVRDEARSRDIPLCVYLPGGSEPAPVVLFSHGLGGTRKGGLFLGKHWSARGYAAVFLQHAGSDIATQSSECRGGRHEVDR